MSGVERRAAHARDLAYDDKSVRLVYGDVSNCQVVAETSEAQKAQKKSFKEFLQQRVPPGGVIHKPVPRHSEYTVEVTFPPDAVIDQNYAADHKRKFPHAYVARRGTTDVWVLPYIQKAHPCCTTVLGFVIMCLVLAGALAVLYAVFAL